MQIAVAQLNTHLGNFEKNEQNIIAYIKKAEAKNVDLIAFPELSIPGFSPDDLLFDQKFLKTVHNSIERIALHSKNIAIIIGAPYLLKDKLYNAAFFMAEGKIQQQHYKTTNCNHGVFQESRYFHTAQENKLIQYKGKKIGIAIGNELWENQDEFNFSFKKLKKQNIDFLFNLSTSLFSLSTLEKRNKLFSSIAKELQTTVCFVNQVGAHADIILDGGASIYNPKGELCHQLPYFEEGLLLSNKVSTPLKTPTINKYEFIEKAIVLGIQDYFKKLNFKTATLGLSGGIDSALGMVLAVKALGARNVTPLLIPSQFSSEHSITDAIQLCKNLGCNYHIVPLEPIYNTFIQQTKTLFKGKDFDTTEENIQSRIRGTLLMAQSNKLGHILLNTSNKSEIAVGYGTLYGDLTGGLSVIGDLYKTEVYELSKYINRNQEVIPHHIIEKPPSAELRPNQVDADFLPHYEILDSILFQHIELQKGVQEIIDSGKEGQLVKRILKLVQQNEYKRNQSMPILRVSKKGFGRGRRMPLVASPQL